MPATALVSNPTNKSHGTTVNGQAADTVNGNTIPNSGNTVIVVSAASATTVVVTVTAKVDGDLVVAGTTPSRTVNVPAAASGVAVLRKLDPKVYGSTVTVKAAAAATLYVYEED